LFHLLSDEIARSSCWERSHDRRKSYDSSRPMDVYTLMQPDPLGGDTARIRSPRHLRLTCSPATTPFKPDPFRSRGVADELCVLSTTTEDRRHSLAPPAPPLARRTTHLDPNSVDDTGSQRSVNVVADSRARRHILSPLMQRERRRCLPLSRDTALGSFETSVLHSHAVRRDAMCVTCIFLKSGWKQR
jgi:hypothetical protein